jgi:uncharacterized membrane protein
MAASALLLILQVLSLSVWIGGAGVLLAVVAPSVFSHFHDRKSGGNLMAVILDRYSSLFIANAIFLSGTVVLQMLLLSPSTELKLRGALALTGVAILTALYGKLVLARRMRMLRLASEAQEFGSPNWDHEKEFRALHRRSMTVFIVNLVLGIMVTSVFILPF